MQRSQKAILQTSNKFGNLGRKHLYFKASFLLVSWAIVFVICSLINHGNSYRDVLADAADDSNRIATPTVSCLSSMHDEDLAMTKSNSTDDYDINETSESHIVRQTQEDYTGAINGSIATSFPEKELETKETHGLNDKTATTTSFQKNGRISRATPLGLDEFKNKTFSAKERSTSSGTIVHRVEPNGIEYNYASAYKGAKVLAFNKEAKGASNILDKDNDKYLRNPCSIEEKFVVIELSEETLVDSFEIANFEHYSSNLKDFELLSSLVYPTDSWVKLGNFTAQNFKHAQRFVLSEPKWSRYLKLNLLNHYGSEFYCTLSTVEVYGVDAVERMLEDLISVENKKVEPDKQNLEQITTKESKDDDIHHKLFTEIDYEPMKESSKVNLETSATNVADPVESRLSQAGRIPGDTVLKILMQKVQNLAVNYSILERYLEELNTRYGRIFNELEDDISKGESYLEKVGLEIKNLQKYRDMLANEIGVLLSWKLNLTSQIDHLVEQNDALRSEIEMMRNQQADTENKQIFVIFISFIVGCIAAFRLFIDFLFCVCINQAPEKMCRNAASFLLLCSSSVILFILLV